MTKRVFILFALLLASPFLWAVWYDARLPKPPDDLYLAATPEIQSCEALLRDMRRAYNAIEVIGGQSYLGTLRHYSNPIFDSCLSRSFTYYVETDTPDPDRFGWRLMDERTLTPTDVAKTKAFRAFLLEHMSNRSRKTTKDTLMDVFGFRSSDIGLGLIRDIWTRYRHEEPGVSLLAFLRCGYPLQRRDLAVAYRRIIETADDADALFVLFDRAGFIERYDTLLYVCQAWKDGANPAIEVIENDL